MAYWVALAILSLFFIGMSVHFSRQHGEQPEPDEK